ncbi:MAG: dephospho-CoA kinase [Aestuariivita sp.]|nr:dephospho-CoA kinase [Aestuariivita sp.]
MSSLVGLTGSIGMGKSTTLKLFCEEGCDTWDADAAVHRLYEKSAEAAAAIGTLYPRAIVDGKVSRKILREIVISIPESLQRIERIVHPLVVRDREQFQQSSLSDVAVLEIPLLFETGGERKMDVTVCVTVKEDIRRKRVLSRRGMTEERFRTLRENQLSDMEKRERSDFVIVTDTIEHARRQVQLVLRCVRERAGYA